MNVKTNCSGCANHCAIDNLKCGKGRNLMSLNKDFDDVKVLKKDDINSQLIRMLREIGHELHFHGEGRGGQKRILTLLSEVDSISQVELTRILGIQPGSVSEVLGKLESKNLIERLPSKVDNRTTTIKITAEGCRKSEMVRNENRIFDENMLSNLTVSEKETLIELLKKINICKGKHHNIDKGMNGHKHHIHHGM